MLGLSRFGRTHALYGRAGLLGYLVVLAVGAGSVVLGIWAANRAAARLSSTRKPSTPGGYWRRGAAASGVET